MSSTLWRVRVVSRLLTGMGRSMTQRLAGLSLGKACSREAVPRVTCQYIIWSGESTWFTSSHNSCPRAARSRGMAMRSSLALR